MIELRTIVLTNIQGTQMSGLRSYASTHAGILRLKETEDSRVTLLVVFSEMERVLRQIKPWFLVVVSEILLPQLICKTFTDLGKAEEAVNSGVVDIALMQIDDGTRIVAPQILANALASFNCTGNSMVDDVYWFFTRQSLADTKSALIQLRFAEIAFS